MQKKKIPDVFSNNFTQEFWPDPEINTERKKSDWEYLRVLINV